MSFYFSIDTHNSVSISNIYNLRNCKPIANIVSSTVHVIRNLNSVARLPDVIGTPKMSYIVHFPDRHFVGRSWREGMQEVTLAEFHNSLHGTLRDIYSREKGTSCRGERLTRPIQSGRKLGHVIAECRYGRCSVSYALSNLEAEKWIYGNRCPRSLLDVLPWKY